MRNPWILALCSGLLLGLAFPPSPLGVVGLVAYVPLLLAWTWYAHAMSRWMLLGLTYVTFFLFHGITNWWVCSWQEQTDPYLFASGIALAIGHPFFLAIPWFLLASIRTHLGPKAMLWIAPLAIGGFEWLHGQTDMSYPWLTSGYMLIDTPMAQAADIVGVYGISTAMIVVNALIAAMLSGLPVKRAMLGGVAAAMLVIWSGYGLLRDVDDNVPATAPVRAAMVQPNENPWDKWTDPRVQVSKHQRIIDSARRAGDVVDLFVWSETAIPYAMRLPMYTDEWQHFRSWVDTTDVAMLAGYSDIVTYAPNTAPPSARTSKADPTLRYDAFNSAMLVMPGRPDIPMHRKTNLTPFAERLPFADQFTFAMEWIQWGVGISAWGKGRLRDPLPLVINDHERARIGVIICIESIYPETARDLVNNGAEVLCVITNDAWYNGTPGPRQHYDIARMRAIEQRRYVMRCGNSGVSGFIDPAGRSIVEIPVMTSGVCVGDVMPRTDRTVYAMVGDLIPPSGAALTILLWLLTRFPALLRKLRVRTNPSSGNETL